MLNFNSMDLPREMIDNSENIRDKFINNGLTDTSVLRPEILDSWQRCKGTIDPHRRNSSEILPAKEIEQLRMEYGELIDIALPVMESLYSFVRGSDYSIILGMVKNEDLILVEFFCSPRLWKENERLNALPGSNWNEKVMGTSAISMALYHDRPFQLYPYENWCDGMRDVSTSAAPIHDPGSLETIGILLIGSVNVTLH